MTVRTGRVDVPVEALAVLAERERVGDLHITLRPEPRWLSRTARAEADKRVEAALAQAGLLDSSGRASVDFLDWLPVLTKPAIEYYGWVNTGGQTYGVLAASLGLQAVLAVASGDWVGLQEIDRRRLPETLIEQLPPVPAGGGRLRTVRAYELEEAARRGPDTHSLPPVIADIVSLVQRPVEGSGELYVGKRDEVGRHVAAEDPLHFADTDWGRYLSYTTGHGNDAVVHIGPAGPAELADALRHVSSTLAG
ncbi:Hypothetical protein AJAP_20420 [Amycolatopsis japonica]|uniref:ESX secretion-associated protein EspG n=1 Tax=Amycolatopsis japonica TaxID=208439 RepID=A0A075V2M2_9PSEU|nr:Hypothetical protein AJAP_20420 [Amycolatopsis japonica]OKK00658.1 hypothetical protein AMK34_03220 [Amycolatopsis sp. CB00013]